MSEEAIALIGPLRKHVMDRSGPAKDDDGNIVLPNGAWAMMLKAADTLEQQAAQIAALRAGADTEDLHAAQAASWLEHMGASVDAAHQIAALEAEAETLHAAADGWRKRAEEAEVKLSGPLPCDVRIPGALIAAGVKIETLLLAISRREPGTKLPERKPAVSWDAVAEARRQALEEAARTIERPPYGLVATKTTSSVVPTINADYAAAAIRALADKPATGEV